MTDIQEHRDGPARAKLRAEHSAHFGQALPEWQVLELPNGKVALESRTHEDDVWLYVTGNFTPEQRLRVANEICEQLNAAERAFDKT